MYEMLLQLTKNRYVDKLQLTAITKNAICIGEHCLHAIMKQLDFVLKLTLTGLLDIRMRCYVFKKKIVDNFVHKQTLVEYGYVM